MKERFPEPENPFAFTERERLFDRISDQRFQLLLVDEQTVVHQVELSTNSFGEFLFVTASRPTRQTREVLAFFGLGFHEYRERWITDVWSWYESSLDPSTSVLPKAEAMQRIRERRLEIAPYTKSPNHLPTRHLSDA